MDLQREFSTDSAAVRDGVWFRMVGGVLLPLRGEVAQLKGDFAEFLLRPTDTKDAQRALRTRQLQSRAALDAGSGPAYDKAVEEIAAGVLADTVVVDWRNIERDGAPLPYSREAAYDVLLAFSRLRSAIDAAASSLAPYRPEQDASALGN